MQSAPIGYERAMEDATRRFGELEALIAGLQARIQLLEQSFRIDQNGDLRISAPGSLTLEASRVSISAAQIQASAPMSEFTGVIRCDTIIANSVVGSSYTPGVGNVM